MHLGRSRKHCMKNRGILQYAADLIYGATKFSNGLLNFDVVRGSFEDNKSGELQEIMFFKLLRSGFRRTVFQLIFPGQTAGVVKKVKPKHDGTNEYHVRFYEDGTIDCEAEVDRWNDLHWIGPRRDGNKYLNELLDEISTLSDETRERIRSLFDKKDYSEKCVRNDRVH